MDKRKELRKLRAVEKRLEAQIDTATSALLHSPDGRAFIWWILGITHYGLTPWTTNALTTSFRCGEHNIGQQLLARMTSVDPEGFLSLLKEKNNADREPNRELREDGNLGVQEYGRDEAGDEGDDE